MQLSPTVASRWHESAAAEGVRAKAAPDAFGASALVSALAPAEEGGQTQVQAQAQGALSLSPSAASEVASPLQALVALKQEGSAMHTQLPPHHARNISTTSSIMQDVASAGSSGSSSASSSTSGHHEDGLDSASVSSDHSLSPPPTQQRSTACNADQRMEDVSGGGSGSGGGHTGGGKYPPSSSSSSSSTSPATRLQTQQHHLQQAHTHMPHHFEFAPQHQSMGHAHILAYQQQQQQQLQHQSQQHSPHHAPLPPPTHASTPPHHHSPHQPFRPPVPLSPAQHTSPAHSSAHHTTSSTAKRGQGFSCHHCKTHKLPESLLFCSNQSKKGPGKKRCRKKYCDSCLRRLYGHPPDQPLHALAASFQCPACLGNCVCAGCERKASAHGGNSAAAATAATHATHGRTDSRGESPHSNGAASDAGSPHHSISARTPSPGPIALPAHTPSNSGNRPAHMHQSKPTTPVGKPPGKKRRTSIDMNVAMDEANAAAQAEANSTAHFTAALTAAAFSNSVMSPPRHHGRALSGSGSAMIMGDGSISGLFSMPPPLLFNSGVAPVLNSGTAAGFVRHSSGGGGVTGSTSLTASPRLAALSAASGSQQGSRMIQLPGFNLGAGGASSVTGGAGGGSSTSSSPRLGPTSLSMTSSTVGATSTFPSHIHQQVAAAVQQAANLQQQYHELSAVPGSHVPSSSPPELMLSTAAGSVSQASPSFTSVSAGSGIGSSLTGLLLGSSAPTSPFSTPQSLARRLSLSAGTPTALATVAPTTTSAFSPVMPATTLAQSGTSTAAGEQDSTSTAGILASHVPVSGSLFTANNSSSSVAAGISPGLLRRTLVLNDATAVSGSAALPPKPQQALAAGSASSSSTSSSTLSVPTSTVLSSNPGSPPAPCSSPNELMRVLATVASTATPTGSVSAASAPPPTMTSTTSASLPPTHPVRELPSPKLSSSFMASMSLLSPTHATAAAGSNPGALSLGLSSTNSGLSHLSAVQSQLKAQHQLELQCLLQAQQQQLAELERLAIRELEGQQQQKAVWQQQQLAQLAHSQSQAYTQPPAAMSDVKGEDEEKDGSKPADAEVEVKAEMPITHDTSISQA